jgi:hypothetical protein
MSPTAPDRSSDPTSLGSSPATAPLPPLPNLRGGERPGRKTKDNSMATLMSGIMPVKSGVDSILSACQQIVRSGVIPGAEQVCGQIIALATALLPMAAQQVLQPGAGGGPIAPVGGAAGPPPPAPGIGPVAGMGAGPGPAPAPPVGP